MATRVVLRHPITGLVRNGYYGFSWTSLFFGFLPALFRLDFLTFAIGFAIYIVLGAFTFGFAAIGIGVVWAFVYNRYYTRRLIENGYLLVGDSVIARRHLGITGTGTEAAPTR